MLHLYWSGCRKCEKGLPSVKRGEEGDTDKKQHCEADEVEESGLKTDLACCYL